MKWDLVNMAGEPSHKGNWFWLYDLLHDMALMYNAWYSSLKDGTSTLLEPDEFYFLHEPKTDEADAQFIDYTMVLYPTVHFTWGCYE